MCVCACERYVYAHMATPVPCLKVLGKSVRVECKSAKLCGMVKELSDGVTETQILQKLWKK